MRPRNIILVSFTAVVKAGGEIARGGAEIYICELAELARNVGYRVTIIQCGDVNEHFEWRGIHIRTIEWEPGLFVRRPRRPIRRIIRDYDRLTTLIICGSEPVSFPVKGYRRLMIQHGIGFDYPTSGSSLGPLAKLRFSRLAHRLVRWEALRAVRSVNLVVCVDYVYPTWLRTFFYRLPFRLITVPNFARIAPSTAIPSRRTYFRVLFARRLVERRGARVMADAARLLLQRHPEIEVTFAGRGPLKNLVSGMFAGEPRVRILEYDPQESLDVHLRHDIAIVPSLASEGTSLSLLEAMAARCAVVATPVGGITNILIDQFNGLFCDPDAGSIANAVGRLYKDPSLASRLAGCGYDTVMRGFSYSHWCESWKAVLSQELDACSH